MTYSIFSHLPKFLKNAFPCLTYKFTVRKWFEFNELESLDYLFRSGSFNKLIKPCSRCEFDDKSRILVLAPHSDDEAIGPGGSLLLAKRNGSKIKIVHFTGCEGIRKEEAINCASIIGADVSFLGLKDGSIKPDQEAQNKLMSEISTWKPNLIMVPFFMDDHPDHRRTSELLCKINLVDFLQISIWSYQVYSGIPGNKIVDITEYAKSKINLIKVFSSQMKTRDWASFSLGLNAWNSRYLDSSGGYAEMFFVLPFIEYKHLAQTFFRRYNTSSKDN